MKPKTPPTAFGRSWVSRETSPLRLDHCVDDVGTFLTLVANDIEAGAYFDPTLNTLATAVGSECRDARGAFATLDSTQ